MSDEPEIEGIVSDIVSPQYVNSFAFLLEDLVIYRTVFLSTTFVVQLCLHAKVHQTISANGEPGTDYFVELTEDHFK